MNRTRAFLAAALGLVLACEGAPPVTLGPRVVETTPAAGADAVPVLAFVELTVSTAIDLDSLTAASVQLAPSSGSGPEVGPTALGWEAETDTITLQPHRALEPATRYTVRVHGLRAQDGAAIPDTSFSFRTTENPQLATR